MGTIDSFTDRYWYLSNFYIAPIEFEGVTYPSNEHAFQAAKTMDRVLRAKICAAVSADAAKRMGRELALRSDWGEVRYDIMMQIVRSKFADESLKEQLLSTGRAELIEGNTWDDQTWGCTLNSNRKWVGKNWLGKILMEIRAELRKS